MDGLEIEAMEYLCSRLCHDLAGPVGAIRNGLELIEESGTDSPEPEALELIGHSVTLAARRLQLFRLAYGRALHGARPNFEEVRQALADWLEGGRVRLDWPPAALAADLAQRPGVAKALLNLAVAGAEMLPQGGTVTIAGSGAPTAGVIRISVCGRALRPPADVDSILAGTADAGLLGPRTIHLEVTRRFARHAELSLATEFFDASRLELILRW
jgi:histidine phosphotransferase ChpT